MPKPTATPAPADVARQTINGRSVAFPKGEEPYYEDSGEAFVKADADALALILAPSATPLDTKGLKIANPSIFFWLPAYEADDNGRTVTELNPLRGFVLHVFRKPAVMTKNDETEGDDTARTRLSAFILLSAPAYARSREKKIVLRGAGEVVWVDLLPAFSAEMRARAPKADDKGNPMTLTEIILDPRGKGSFVKNGKSRQIWRVDFYETGRTLSGNQIAAVKRMLVMPGIPGEDDFEDETPPAQLPAPAAAPALPANAGPSANGTPAS